MNHTRRWLAMDLHVHTVLSACAETEMLPPLIVERALDLGLAAVGITDHNSAENAGAVQAAADGTGLTVFPGLEVQTREEVDILALFGKHEAALAMQEQVYRSLGGATNRPEFFGEQIVVDAGGRPLRENRRLLQGATSMSLEAAASLVRNLGGMALAAHVDRPSRSLIANLGFVPAGLALDGIEVSRWADPRDLLEEHADLRRFGVGSFGDAHRLSQMCRRTEFCVTAATLDQVRQCFRPGAGGVRVIASEIARGARQENG